MMYNHRVRFEGVSRITDASSIRLSTFLKEEDGTLGKQASIHSLKSIWNEIKKIHPPKKIIQFMKLMGLSECDRL
jgi:hypothetical protein